MLHFTANTPNQETLVFTMHYWLLLLIVFRGVLGQISLSLLSERVAYNTPFRIIASAGSMGECSKTTAIVIKCVDGFELNLNIPFSTPAPVSLGPSVMAEIVCEVRVSKPGETSNVLKFAVVQAKMTARLPSNTVTAGEGDLEYWVETEGLARVEIKTTLTCAGKLLKTHTSFTARQLLSFPLERQYFGKCLLAVAPVKDRNYLPAAQVELTILSPILITHPPPNTPILLGATMVFRFFTFNGRYPTMAVRITCPQHSFLLRASSDSLSVRLQSTVFGRCVARVDDALPFYNASMAVTSFLINRPVNLTFQPQSIIATEESFTAHLKAPMGGSNDTFGLIGQCTHGDFVTPVRFLRLDRPVSVLGFDGQVYGECKLEAVPGAQFYEAIAPRQKLIINRPVKILEPVKGTQVSDELLVLVQSIEVITLNVIINCSTGPSLTLTMLSNTQNTIPVAGLYGDCQLTASTNQSFYQVPSPVPLVILIAVSIQVPPICRYLQSMTGTVHPSVLKRVRITCSYCGVVNFNESLPVHEGSFKVDQMTGFGSCFAEDDDHEVKEKYLGKAKAYFRSVAPVGLHLDCAGYLKMLSFDDDYLKFLY